MRQPVYVHIPERLRGALHVTAEESGVQGQWQDCLQDSLGKCSLHGDDCLLLLVSVFTEMFDDQKTGVVGAAVEVVRHLPGSLITPWSLHTFSCGILFASICENPICLLAFTGHSGTLLQEVPWTSEWHSDCWQQCLPGFAVFPSEGSD